MAKGGIPVDDLSLSNTPLAVISPKSMLHMPMPIGTPSRSRMHTKHKYPDKKGGSEAAGKLPKSRRHKRKRKKSGAGRRRAREQQHQ